MTAPAMLTDVLPRELLERCIEFLAFKKVRTTAKRVSRDFRAAARRALTRGRWRPLREFCDQGVAAVIVDGYLWSALRGTTCSDETKARFRDAWALEPATVLVELRRWPCLPDQVYPDGPHRGKRRGFVFEEGPMRFFDIVEPTIDGIGRLVAAIGRARMRVGVNKAANRHNWAHYVLRSWCHQRENIFNGGMRIRPGRVAKHQLLLDNQPSDLGFHAWKDPKKAAGLVLETCLAWGYHDGTLGTNGHRETSLRHVNQWKNLHEKEIMLQMIADAPVDSPFETDDDDFPEHDD
mmetsp:Transcript_14106/g.42143  ORF Transcript_14106/g.42143 Transcript_14106/m.42143 type:complete len:293 (-) Transcript_14106:28-906(-)